MADVTSPADLKPITLAYQGNPGSYSEMAALDVATRRSCHSEYIQAIGQPNFDLAAKAVIENHADLAVLPIENSLMGSIHESLDAILQADLPVVGETIVRVNHCLMALPGVKLEDIRRVISQKPALDQCTQFTEQHHLEQVAGSDTAGSAQELAKSQDRTTAVIASARAAQLYGLNVLRYGIENKSQNYTRFLVLGHQAPIPASSQDKTSLVLEIDNHAATMRPLCEFDILHLAVRPVPEQPWKQRLYIELAGNVTDTQHLQILADFQRSIPSMHILGSFPQVTLPDETMVSA